MALDAGLTGAMAALVGASAFLIGFLTTRVHQALHRATDRAVQIDDRLLAGEFNPAWIDEEQEVLSQAVQQQFPRAVEGATWVFAALVGVLAIVAAADAGVDNWPNAATLIAFVVAETAIVLVGIVDTRLAKKLLEERLANTLLTRFREGAAALNLARASDAGPRRVESALEAEKIATDLEERTRGAWADAVGLRALAEAIPRLDGDHWIGDEKTLNALTERFADLTRRDPRHDGWWSAHARFSELQKDWVEAGRSWVAAEALPTRRRAWRGQPIRLEPVLPQTFANALQTLERERRLHERLARNVFAKLVSALVVEHDGALPDVLPESMRRIAQALVDADDLGFIDADLWLQNPEPILETWPPELLAEAARLRQKLVPPAEKRYDAQWNLDPQANDSM